MHVTCRCRLRNMLVIPLRCIGLSGLDFSGLNLRLDYKIGYFGLCERLLMGLGLYTDTHHLGSWVSAKRDLTNFDLLVDTIYGDITKSHDFNKDKQATETP